MEAVYQAWSDERNAPRFVTILAHVDPRLNQKANVEGVGLVYNPYWKDCIKISHCVVMINWKYSAAVNNARDKYAAPHVTDEAGAVDHFTSKPRKWGVRMPETPFVEHCKECKTKTQQDGELVHKDGCSKTQVFKYLECRVMSYIMHQYRRISTNEIIPNICVKLWQRSRSSNADWQGVIPEKEILVRDYQTCNIKSAKSGELFSLVEEEIAVSS